MDDATNKLIEKEQAFARVAKSAGPVTHEDLGEMVERKWNEGLKDLGSKLWRGLLQFAASDFGKGMLVMAGVILATAGVLFGFGAGMGAITSSSGAVATVGQGIGLGIGQAFELLVHPVGWAILAAGGALGIAVATKKEPKKVSSGEEAEKLAIQYALSRQRAQQQTIAADDIPPDGHVAEQLSRRASQNIENNQSRA